MSKINKYFKVCKECLGSGRLTYPLSEYLSCSACCGYGWIMSEEQKQKVSKKLKAGVYHE